MITIKGKFLNWNYFPEKISHSPGSVFLFTGENTSKLFMEKQTFKTAELCILKDEKELLLAYSRTKKYEIIRASREATTIDITTQKEGIVRLFAGIAPAIGCRGVTADQFPKEDNYIIISAKDEENEVVASQAYLYDLETSKALLYINASTFRKEDVKSRKSYVSRTNNFLFHRSMLWLRDKGINHLYLQFSTKENPTPGVDFWKRGFGGKEVILYNYYPILYWKYRNMRGWKY